MEEEEVARRREKKRSEKRREKRRAVRLRRRTLQRLATGALPARRLRFGGFARFAGFGFVGADFAQGGVARELASTPHVPTRDGAVRSTAFAKGQEFLGLGHVFFAVGDGPAFFDTEVVDGENIGAAEAEDQEHFDRPCADATDGDEALDEFFVGERLGLLKGGDDAFDGFFGEVFHGGGFCAREAGSAELAIRELEHFFGRRWAAVGAERLNAGEDRGGGLAGNGLIGDGFEESFVGGLQMVGVGLEGNSVGDEFGEFFVAGGEMLHGLLEIEGRGADGLGRVFGHGVSKLD